jgi:site-specific DNA-methyltransferase (adenine-specific)
MSQIAINQDCMIGMKDYPDKYFDLAIVDPPYGMHRKMDGPDGAGRIMRKFKRDTPSWDVKPPKEYFTELQRISKNQIIWGGNNFIEWLSNTTGFIFWYKHQPAPNFADGELAWTSFQIPAKCFDHPCFGAHGQDPNGKQHPTQKPIKLYKWILKNYAKPGDKILDTHLGSGSSRIAAYEMGFDFTGFEIDKDYFEASEKRFRQHISQTKLFEKLA